MKIDEPKTPFGNYDSDEDSEHRDELDANLLAAKITAEGHKGPRPRRFIEYTSTYQLHKRYCVVSNRQVGMFLSNA